MQTGIQVMLMNVSNQLFSNYTLHQFRNEAKSRYWAVVFQVLNRKRGLLMINITCEKMNHQTAVLFNGGFVCLPSLFNGALSADHARSILPVQKLIITQLCLMGLYLLANL